MSTPPDASSPPALSHPPAPTGYLRLHWSELALLLLMIAAAAPVWVLRYLPMQDYPQHLFQAKLVIQHLDGLPVDPAYTVELHPTYSIFYLLVWLFAKIVPLAVAGRAAVTLYFLLMYLAARRVLWINGREAPPAYAAFLLAPLAINHAYYLGFLNYLYALPLVLLAWMDVLFALRSGWTRPRAIAHALLLVAIMISNAIALAMFLAVDLLWLLLVIVRAADRRRVGYSLTCAVGCVGLWTLMIRGGQGQGFAPAWGSLLRNLEFWAMGFTGYRLRAGPHWITLLLWLAVPLALLFTGWKPRRRLPLLLAGAGAGLLTLATLLGPFSSGGVGYVTLRMAEGAYLLLLLLAALGELPLLGGGIVALLAAGLVTINTFQQAAISAETRDIEPLIARMAPGSTVYPQPIDPFTPQLDAYTFQIHLHDIYYYHLNKGGLSPYLFPTRSASGTPVAYAPGVHLPAPPQDNPRFLWEIHGSAYRYVLIRGGTERIFNYLERGANFLEGSGKWRLYERRPPAATSRASPTATSP